VHIPKGSYDQPDLKPAWLPTVEHGTSRPLKPIIRCACGKLAGIGLHHVHPDGRVTASFYHPLTGWAGEAGPGCGFHEFLTLDGWTGEDFPPTQT